MCVCVCVAGARRNRGRHVTYPRPIVIVCFLHKRTSPTGDSACSRSLLAATRSATGFLRLFMQRRLSIAALRCLVCFLCGSFGLGLQSMWWLYRVDDLRDDAVMIEELHVAIVLPCVKHSSSRSWSSVESHTPGRRRRRW